MYKQERDSLITLLDNSRRETLYLIQGTDPNQVIHDDEGAWRVRDILAHIASWETETVQSLTAYLEGGHYRVEGYTDDYDYNTYAISQRYELDLEDIYAEFEGARAGLKRLVGEIPDDLFLGEMVYPWDDLGTLDRLIRETVSHEAEHRRLIARALRQ